MSHGTKIIHDYKQKITAQPIINIHTFQTMNVILKIQKFRQQLLFKNFCQKFSDIQHSLQKLLPRVQLHTVWIFF